MEMVFGNMPVHSECLGIIVRSRKEKVFCFNEIRGYSLSEFIAARPPLAEFHGSQVQELTKLLPEMLGIFNSGNSRQVVIHIEVSQDCIASFRVKRGDSLGQMLDDLCS